MVHIIKVYLVDHQYANVKQIRRLAVSSEIVSSLNLLQLKIKSLFQVNSGDFHLTWKDADGDMISMSTDEELAQAIANAEDGILKLYWPMNDNVEAVPDLKFQATGGCDSTPKAEGGEVHAGVVCDSCDNTIRGVRYKCLHCRDFDLCSACNRADKHPHHDMLKLVKPVQFCREWTFLGARRLWRSMFGRVPRGFHASATASTGQAQQQHSPSSSSSDENPEDYQKAFADFMKGDFVPAQNLITETFGHFLKNFGAVDVKLEQPIFNPDQPHKKQKTDSPQPPKEDKAEETAAAAASQPMEVVSNPTEVKEAEAVPEKPTGLFKAVPMEELNTAVKALVLENKPGVDAEQNLIDLKDQSTTTCEHPAQQDSDSNCVDGWTLLHREDPSQGACAPVQSMYPSVDVVEAKPTEQIIDSPAQCLSFTDCKDPKIVDGVVTMLNMGFTNEGGWLERLLIAKGGNIAEVLDALYPAAR